MNNKIIIAVIISSLQSGFVEGSNRRETQFRLSRGAPSPTSSTFPPFVTNACRQRKEKIFIIIVRASLNELLSPFYNKFLLTNRQHQHIDQSCHLFPCLCNNIIAFDATPLKMYLFFQLFQPPRHRLKVKAYCFLFFNCATLLPITFAPSYETGPAPAPAGQVLGRSDPNRGPNLT